MLARRKGITEHNRQKALYDVKVHGAPYQVVTGYGYIHQRCPGVNVGNYIIPGLGLLKWLSALGNVTIRLKARMEK